MHGLINLAIELFLRETYGLGVWSTIARRAGLEFDRFEAMMIYDPAVTTTVIQAAADVLNRPLDALMEDVGTFLVSPRAGERLRRLMRYGGGSFVDFLHSLEELPDRARLALPDLVLPQLEVEDLAQGEFCLRATPPFPGAGYILLGLLRSMADDYGALALLDLQDRSDGCEEIMISLLDVAHAEGRGFDLAAGIR